MGFELAMSSVKEDDIVVMAGGKWFKIWKQRPRSNTQDLCCDILDNVEQRFGFQQSHKQFVKNYQWTEETTQRCRGDNTPSRLTLSTFLRVKQM